MQWTVLFLFICFLNACAGVNQVNNETAAVDKDQMQKISNRYCPVGKKLTLFTGELGVYRDPFPDPIVFTFIKGNGHCAQIYVDHGGPGLSSWLKISSNTLCVTNGSLWVTTSINIMDGNHVYWDLTSYDNSDMKIHINTNYGYSLSSIRTETGMLTYTCL